MFAKSEYIVYNSSEISSHGEMDITQVFGTWFRGSNPLGSTKKPNQFRFGFFISNSLFFILF